MCPDSVDSCVSPALKVSVCIGCYVSFWCRRLLCEVCLKSLHLILLLIKNLVMWIPFPLSVTVLRMRFVFVCVVFVIAL